MKKKAIISSLILLGCVVSINAQVVKGTVGTNGASGGGVGGGEPTGPAILYLGNGMSMIGANSPITNLNVGIGTNNPTEKLEVNGNIRANSIKGSFLTSTGSITCGGSIASAGMVQGASFSSTGNLNTASGFFTGNVGIGTTNPSNVQGWSKVLDVAGTDHSKILATANNATFKTGLFTHSSWQGGGGFVGTESNHTLFLIAGYDPKMTILTNGNVGVGTKNPDAKLTVNGDIHASEVRVNTSIPVPDYVFTNDYKLKTLQEVENYIKENSHLPEIPSAKEIEKNGLFLAEMNMNLLKKVEEVTLYLIQQNKEIEELRAQVKALSIKK
jgi:hypothetical protein